MATAPNMNVAPMVPQVGLPPAIEGEGGDLFASLLPIVTGMAVPDAGAPDAASLPVTTGGVGIGMPIQQPGSVPVQMLAVDLHSVVPKAQGEEPATGDPVEADDASAQLDTDLLPLLQAQSLFPVTVVAAPAPAPAPTAASGPEVSNAAMPAPASQTVPQPPVTLGATPLPAPTDNAIVTDDPAIAVAVREAARALVAGGKEGSDTPVSKKAVGDAKGDVVQPARQLVDAVAPAPIRSATTGDVTAERAAPIDKSAMSSPVPVQASVVQASLAPTAAMPVVATIDPAASLQLAPAEAAAPQTAPASDAAITRELDLAHDSEWLDRLARDIARTGANDGPMRFKLHPQTLGHLHVELSQGDHGTSVRLTVETEAARTILADAQPRLMAEARAQGVRISESNVDLAGHGHQAASGDPRRHQDDARQNVFIRTARGSAGEAAETAVPARGRADRYA